MKGEHLIVVVNEYISKNIFTDSPWVRQKMPSENACLINEVTVYKVTEWWTN